MLLAAGPLLAQGPYGTTPKAKAADYPVHAQAGPVSVAAEYLVRSIPVGDQILIVPDYLVVEVALYPPPAGRSRSPAVSSPSGSMARSRCCTRKPPGSWLPLSSTPTGNSGPRW